MPRLPSKEFLLAICVALAGALINVSIWPPPQQPQSPQVRTEQKTSETIQTEHDAQHRAAEVRNGRDHQEQDAHNEASEFWTIFGRHLKITDTLLVLFTFTLWWSTRALVKEAKASSERQLRAYVDIVSGQILNFGAGNVRLRVVVKNSGQTPAYQLRQWTAVGADTIPPKHGFPIEEVTDRTSTLAPGGFHTVIQEYGPLSSEHVAAIVAEKSAIWAWGQIDYVDAFGHARKSRFRLIYNGSNATDPDGGMRVDAEGNGAD